MIVTEYFMTREDGVVLNRTYSDRDMMIERDGELYADAIDPDGLERIYTETNMPIENRTTHDVSIWSEIEDSDHIIEEQQ